MPVILVLLFIIALLMTGVGLILSPKSPAPARRSRNSPSTRMRIRPVSETAVMIPARESTRVTSASTRSRRRLVESTSTLVTAEEGRAMAAASLPVRANRRARLINVDMGVVIVQPQQARPGTRKARINATNSAVPWSLKGFLWSWKIAIPGLATLFLLSLYLFVTVFPHQAVWMPVWFGVSNAQAAPRPTSIPVYDASGKLKRLGQLDRGQYDSQSEYDTWAYSACSAAAMTVVINAYSHHYRITDILTVESQIHEITPQDGLLEEIGIQRTGAKFGFKTVWGHNYTLDQVIAAANKGTPVIVSFPPYKWPGGHLLVVRGGDKNTVLLTDSSSLNWTQFTRQHFLELWGGFYAIMTPA
ncbi:MAG TPA: C39 family peptidase [Ktedonobacteraceae bacterium]|nr:C39 family peptidase [Ktedonobacteraceae bacterium]